MLVQIQSVSHALSPEESPKGLFIRSTSIITHTSVAAFEEVSRQDAETVTWQILLSGNCNGAIFFVGSDNYRVRLSKTDEGVWVLSLLAPSKEAAEEHVNLPEFDPTWRP